MSATTCSAPGKILLAGGYLVLDPSYSGLVLSLSARIFATVSHDGSSQRLGTEGTRQETVLVKSPQFPEATWSFTRTGNGPFQAIDDKDNPFVRESLSVVGTYLSRVSLDGLVITIHADNEYYSLPPSNQRFTKSQHTLQESPKTGLGSSAALVTALCAALYYRLAPDARQDSAVTIDVIHKLSQIAHCRAQGKVGSGFDVASAVHGSCRYSRFPPSLIESLPAQPLPEVIQSLVDTTWPMQIEEVTLRSDLKLLMGDVKQGSNTPSMVKEVLASSAAMAIWPSLNISNEILCDYLIDTSDHQQQQQDRTDREIATASRTVRHLLKEMGIAAGVEIEPDAQTSVLDDTLTLPGVVACGVPGAGGYDAIYAVIRSSSSSSSGEADSTVQSRVEEVWRAAGVSLLSVTDDGHGIRLEEDFQNE